jgi:hypothetical protein
MYRRREPACGFARTSFAAWTDDAVFRRHDCGRGHPAFAADRSLWLDGWRAGLSGLKQRVCVARQLSFHFVRKQDFAVIGLQLHRHRQLIEESIEKIHRTACIRCTLLDRLKLPMKRGDVSQIFILRAKG